MIDFAIEFAAKAHRNQVRKGTDIPYIAHPYAVGLLLLRAGCSEEVVVAGILHDTVEDTSMTLEDIRKNFGDKIAAVVKGCSEPDKSLAWEARKQHTIEFLRTAPLEVRMVVCADKLHNLRTIAVEHQKIGDEVWKRFNRGRKEQEWYYRALVESLCYQLDVEEKTTLFQQFLNEVENVFGKK